LKGNRVQLVREQQMMVAALEQLDAQTSSLKTHSAKALAKLEIAETLWSIAPVRSKELLIEALRLTFPSRDEKPVKGHEVAKGLFAPSPLDQGRRSLRNSIFRVAAGDREFSDELRRLLAKELGAEVKSQQLAEDAVSTGDPVDVRNYLESVAGSGESGMNIGQVIYALAIRDREAADELILEMIANLRERQMSVQSFRSTISGLDVAVFGPWYPGPPRIRSSADPVIAEYLSFQIYKIGEIGASRPGGFQEARGLVTSLWPRISRYAPELIPRFQLLEIQSRLSPNDDSLPEPSNPETQRTLDESVYEKAKNSRKAEDIDRAIGVALGKRDFSKAKEMAGLFDDQKLRRDASNRILGREAVFFIKNKEWDNAEKTARMIDDSRLGLESYSALVYGLKETQQTARVRSLLFEVWRRLGTFDGDRKAVKPLSEIVIAAQDIDSSLAFDLLFELVKRLDRSPYDKDSGRLDFNASSFSSMSRIDFSKSKQTCEMLSDPLQQIIALAHVYRPKALTLSEQIKKLAAGRDSGKVGKR
jgi:hypothetical protein